jgi:hypothetical protein
MKQLKRMTGAVWLAGLLTLCSTPAMAQFADPLTLAASGAILPFFGSGNNISVLEISSPVGANPGMHMIFYDATCSRVVSAAADQTANDIDLIVASGTGAGGILGNVDGLVAIAAASANGIDLAPGGFIHTRTYWINVPAGRFRVLEPILIDTPDSSQTDWVPLRTGVTFFAPQEGPGGFQTTLYLICPKDTIQGAPGSAFPAGSFPIPSASATPVFKSSYAAGSLRGRVYDDDENPLRNLQTNCDCLQTRTLSGPGGLDAVYTTTDTFTELETDGTFAGFTGYKALGLTTAPQVDFFGRLSNTNRIMLQGIFTPGVR